MQTLLDTLLENSTSLLSRFSIMYRRYFVERIDFSQKLVGIIGARGIGKTTAMMQHLKASDLPYDKKLYISADMIELADTTLFDVAKAFAQRGGKVLAIDEIHKSPSFEKQLKNIYDRLDIRVIFSGSSAIELEHAQADLSRRAALYRVQGLSFREFLELKTSHRFDAYTLDALLRHHSDIAVSLLRKIKPLEYFDEYLAYGYYPFYFEHNTLFFERLEATVNTVIEVDLPAVFSIRYEHVVKLKKLVKMLCSSVPYKVNMSQLSDKTGIPRDKLYRYIDYLSRASVLQPLYAKSRGDGIFVKPEKLYLHNSNLYRALCHDASVGTVRESFVLAMLGLSHDIRYPRVGDVEVDNKVYFEIGGRKKGYAQVKDCSDAYILADGIEVGVGHKLPLWLLGFLY